jgi:hypothetical protein
VPLGPKAIIGVTPGTVTGERHAGVLATAVAVGARAEIMASVVRISGGVRMSATTARLRQRCGAGAQRPVIGIADGRTVARCASTAALMH